MGPRVLILRWQWYINIMIRVNPFYFRMKFWLTRSALIRDYRKAREGMELWTEDTIKIGSLKFNEMRKIWFCDECSRFAKLRAVYWQGGPARWICNLHPSWKSKNRFIDFRSDEEKNKTLEVTLE